METNWKKLTPYAEKELDNIVHEFSEQLLEEANLIAAKNKTSGKEISLNDILEAKRHLLTRSNYNPVFEEDFNKSRREIVESLKNSSENRRTRTTNMMILATTLAGLLYIIIGVFSYFDEHGMIFMHNDTSFTFIIIGVIVIFTSFFMSIIMNYMRKLRVDKNKESDQMNEIIFNLWSRIEFLGKSLMEGSYNKAFINGMKNANNYLDIIDGLFDTTEEKAQFKELLNVRNKIFHGDYQNVTITEKKDAINVAFFIINRLENQINAERSFNSSSNFEEIK